MIIKRFSQHADASPPYSFTNEIVVELSDGSEEKIETDEKTITQLIALLGREAEKNEGHSQEEPTDYGYHVGPYVVRSEPGPDRSDRATIVLQSLSEQSVGAPPEFIELLNSASRELLEAPPRNVIPVSQYHIEDESEDGTQI